MCYLAPRWWVIDRSNVQAVQIVEIVEIIKIVKSAHKSWPTTQRGKIPE